MTDLDVIASAAAAYQGEDLPYLGLTYREACDAREWLGEKSVSQPGRYGCRIWQGTKDKAGYGVVRFKGKTYRAHRLVWLLQKSDIPGGLLVCHHCDTPGCVESTHLWLGTHEDNAADCYRKGRLGRGARKTSKFTDHDVIVLRRMVGIFKTRASLVARAHAHRFGCAEGTLYQALTGMTWGHLPSPQVREWDLRCDERRRGVA